MLPPLSLPSQPFTLQCLWKHKIYFQASPFFRLITSIIIFSWLLNMVLIFADKIIVPFVGVLTLFKGLLLTMTVSKLTDVLAQISATCPSAHLPVSRLPVSLSPCLPVSLSPCSLSVSTSAPVSLHVSLSGCLYLCLFLSVSVCWGVRIRVCLPVSHRVCLIIHLHVYILSVAASDWNVALWYDTEEFPTITMYYRLSYLSSLPRRYEKRSQPISIILSNLY